jgi:hydrogenase maturation protein HypF
LPWLPDYEAVARFIPTMISRRLNSPESTSCGRLFDAVAALLGLCNATSYEGQAAIRLEEAQFTGEEAPAFVRGRDVFSESRLSTTSGDLAANRALSVPSEAPEHPANDADAVYACPVLRPTSGSGCRQLDTGSLFRAIWEDWQAETPVPVIARRFHASLARGLADLAAAAAAERGIRHVGLSGGCMQNKTLAVLLSRRLRQKGLIPLLHIDLPPNDACISLGQASWGLLAARQWQRRFDPPVK